MSEDKLVLELHTIGLVLKQIQIQLETILENKKINREHLLSTFNPKYCVRIIYKGGMTDGTIILGKVLDFDDFFIKVQTGRQIMRIPLNNIYLMSETTDVFEENMEDRRR